MPTKSAGSSTRRGVTFRLCTPGTRWPPGADIRFKKASSEADASCVRVQFNRVFGSILFVLFAASWLMPGGLSLPGGWGVNGHGIVQDVAPPLHSGTPWSAYLAPKGTCRGDSSSTSTQPEQVFAMRCLLDWARVKRGLPRLRMDSSLVRSSELKAGAIASCNDFSHTPCGTDFSATFTAAGWRGNGGENIAWGTSMAGSPRVLVDGWLHSDGHRENLFRPEWVAQGLGMLRPSTFQGEDRAAIWVHQFGR